MGTYMHGILDNAEFVDWILAPYAEKCARKEFDYAAYKEEQYNKLADVIRANVDMDKLYRILERND
jgi:adenosylcobyric acid synthase